MSWLVVAVLNALSWFFARVLGARRSIALGRALGSFAFYCVPVRRRIVFENLRRAFPEKSGEERRQIALDVYRQFGRVVAETIFLPHLPAEEISKLIRFRNKELLDEAVRQGNGFIFCMAHMGNWEMVGFEAHRLGLDSYAITKVLKGSLNKKLHATRKAVFKELPPRDSFEQGLAALETNAGLALIIDQHRSGDKAVVVNFFGRPAATSPSPALFHLRSNAPVFTAWVTVGPDDSYDVWIRGPYPVPEAATLAERLQLHTQWIASDLEAFIRKRPAEWYWVHRRWKVPDSTPVPHTDLQLEFPPMPGLQPKDAA